MKRLFWGLLVFGLGVGCAETEECKELDKLLTESQRAAQAVKGRATLWERVSQRANQKEANTKKLMAELGLDLGEEQLQATLEERIKAIPGATFERTVRVADGEAQGPTAATETLFVINIPTKDPTAAIAQLRILWAAPPLLRIETIVQEKGKGWRLELGRAEIDQVPVKVEPVQPKARTSPDTVPSQFGFCGAAAKRKQLATMEEEIKALEGKAAEVTTLLPAAASWEGLGRRVELVREVETEARRLINLVLDAALKSKVHLKAIGTEQELVMAELIGTAKDRAKLQNALDPDTIAQMQLPETEVTPGVARFGLPNRVAKERRRPDQGGNAPTEPGSEHPDHPGH
ncbi:MAG: hypothetical protein IPG45_22300 [Deltaproteobacteria bacterium]|nr:hypothetical protein [Deltaproteobacteria bacterium]